MEEELKEEVVEEAKSNPYEIDYSDSRFADVEAAKIQALSNVDSTYGGMIDKANSFYEEQINASKDWEEQQKNLMQEQSDFTIEKIEQQKEQAKKDYTKEQSGAYKDWKKQSNEYGVNAEQMAAQGMNGTGYSESTQAAMYNSYQSRVASANEAFTRATVDYDNAITEAKLQNNSAMAELALESYKQRLELALSGFQYENQLILDQVNKTLEVENMFYGRYQDVLDQINKENSLTEQIRQYNESLAEEQRHFNFYNNLGEFAPDASGGSGGSGGSGAGSIGAASWAANNPGKHPSANPYLSATPIYETGSNGLPQIAGGENKVSSDKYRLG